MDKKVYLTVAGLQSLKDELKKLEKVERPANIIALKEARALGDLSENAEYDAARNEQSLIENSIKVLVYKIDNAELIKDANTDVVSLGNTVTIVYLEDNDEEEYMLVGSTEADPFANKISNESPIAKAILGKKVNDEVTVISPEFEYKIKIKNIA
jgi:transcription elongation factor GreA